MILLVEWRDPMAYRLKCRAINIETSSSDGMLRVGKGVYPVKMRNHSS